MAGLTHEAVRQTYELSDPSDIGRKIVELQNKRDQQERYALVQAILPELLGELSGAHAPYSGKETACVIITSAGTYGGHVYEHEPGNFETAEAMALAKIPSDDTELRAIFVTGIGSIKPKHAMPSFASYDAIRERFFSAATHRYHPLALYLVSPDIGGNTECFDYWALKAAYEPRRFSAFQGSGGFDSIHEILDLTQLNERDARFLGSAAAQGGVSVVINDSYDDLDIIAVSDIKKETVESMLEAHATEFYGPLEKLSKTVRRWSDGEDVHGIVLKNEQISIDFFAAQRLEDAVIRPENIERNFFHKIS